MQNSRWWKGKRSVKQPKNSSSSGTAKRNTDTSQEVRKEGQEATSWLEEAKGFMVWGVNFIFEKQKKNKKTKTATTKKRKR